ncbi:MAG: alpha/beta hydrolase [Gammaproteobacteria bacterium]|nr:alpha/beta hydrolase [Gammaproteobacteria bacterium]
MPASAGDGATGRVDQLDFADTAAALAKLLEVPPETALDLRALNDALSDAFNQDPPDVGAVHEDVPVNGHLRTTVVVPEGSGPFPVLLYVHGGAWVAGGPRHYAKLSRRFAEAGFLTFVIDYRLAPEHPFPAGWQDCVDAARWVARECGRWGGDGSRLAIGGDSAGANLSAAVVPALASSEVRLKAIVLIYGAFDFEMMLNRPAHGEADERLNLANRIAAEAYLGDDIEQLVADPRVSPIHDVSGMPPAHIVVGAEDALVPQSEALVRKLEAAGVEHEYFCDPHMPHGYLQMEMLPPSAPALARIVAFLTRCLALGEGRQGR